MKKYLFLALFISIFFSCKDLDNPISCVEYTDTVVVTSSTVTTTRSGTENLPVETKIEPYAIGKYEVTYELYFAVLDWAKENGFSFSNEGSAGSVSNKGGSPESVGFKERYYPVSNVSWADIIVWCNAYSKIKGMIPVYYLDEGYTDFVKSSTDSSEWSNTSIFIDSTANGIRLPTLAEWEFAARGADCNNVTVWNYKFAGGPREDLEEVAVCGVSSTACVGSKRANTLGLYDMSGNVWECLQEMCAKGASYGTSWICAANHPVQIAYSPFNLSYVFCANFIGFRIAYSI